MSLPVMEYKALFDEGHPELEKKDTYTGSWEIIHNEEWKDDQSNAIQWFFEEYK